MPKKYLILSCDGGGIRGLLTALLLKELDKSCGLLQRVDLFAGTSTGGILAIGLAGGLGIDRLIDLYKAKAKNIFEKSDLTLTEKVFTSAALEKRPHHFERPLSG